MNNDFYNYKKCIDDLTSVLSVGYFYQYSMKVIEKRIIESKYFSLFNTQLINRKAYMSTNEVLDEIFPEVDNDTSNMYYDELEWVATMYIYLINKTNYNFETLFIYISIDEAIRMYKIYHELDLNKSYDQFIKLKEVSSIINKRMKALKLTNQIVSKKTGISLSSIDALRNRRRDIKKLDVLSALKLSRLLKINIYTLLNN